MVKRYMDTNWMQTPTGEFVRYADYAALEARCRQYEEAFHKAFNQFENITVADTLEIAKERAHQMIGWAYASMPDYAPETGTDQSTKGEG